MTGSVETGHSQQMQKPQKLQSATWVYSHEQMPERKKRVVCAIQRLEGGEPYIALATHLVKRGFGGARWFDACGPNPFVPIRENVYAWLRTELPQPPKPIR